MMKRKTARNATAKIDLACLGRALPSGLPLLLKKNPDGESLAVRPGHGCQVPNRLFAIVDQDERLRPDIARQGIIVCTVALFLHSHERIGEREYAVRKPLDCRRLAGILRDPVFEGAIHLRPCWIAACVAGPDQKIGTLAGQCVE